MKKFNDICSNKGFTLIELVVALLISGILMATVSSVFLISQKVYTRGADIDYKEGTVTNTETNLQNLLAVATGVYLASTPKIDDEESYSIGFNADGICQEYNTSLVVDGSGNINYSKTVTAIPHLSEIEIEAINKNLTTLNYKLMPKDDTMSTLVGGTVMNNINAINKNQPSQAKLVGGTKLKISGDELHYLILTFKDINGGTVVPVKTINDMLKDKGIVAGDWNKMIAYANRPDIWGYKFYDEGSVYTDYTGTYVTAKTQYIGDDYAGTNPTAEDYYNKMGGSKNEVFFKISETTRVITEADYDTDPNTWENWKTGKVPVLGDLYLYNGVYYVWQSGSSYYACPQDPSKDKNWLRLVSAPEMFQ